MKKIVLFILLIIAFLIIIPRLLPLFSFQGKIDPPTLVGVYNFLTQRAVYENKAVAMPPYLAQKKPATNVLGEYAGEKIIFIDLAKQRLYAYEGVHKIYDFKVSTGKWNRTPTGVFRIWTKLKYTLMAGGSQALGTYYYLPNVPYTMFFYNADYPQTAGYGIHGTYWHDNFGHPMSHGCINMKTEEAEELFYWATPTIGDYTTINATVDNPGTTVIIYGTAPEE